MTQRTRQAIMDYWISKHALYWRRCSRCFVLSAFLLSFTHAAGFAAETKNGQAVNLMKLLDSKTVADSREKAKTEKANPEKKIEKTVKGTVGSVRKYSISVEFSQSEEAGGEEMLIPVKDKLKLKGIKDISELSRGDQVLVKYRQTYLEPKKKGDEPAVLNTMALEISLLQRAADLEAAILKAAAAAAPAAPKTESVEL